MKNVSLNYSNIVTSTISSIVSTTKKGCQEADIRHIVAANIIQEWLGIWIVCILGILGVLLNVVAIFALISKRAPKNLFNLILINIFAWDTIFLILHISRRLTSVEDADGNVRYACTEGNTNFLVPLWNIALAQSTVMTMLLSIERYVSIKHSAVYKKYIETPTASRCRQYVKYILPCTILTFLLHLAEFFATTTEVQLISLNSKNDHCTVTINLCFHYEELRKTENVSIYYRSFVKLVIDGIIPLSCLIYCNITVFLEVKNHMRSSLPIRDDKSAHLELDQIRLSNEANKNRKEFVRSIEHKLAKILIGIVVVFIICQFPYLGLTASQSIYLTKFVKEGEKLLYPTSVFICESVSNFMLTINASVNVIIYCFFDTDYKSIILFYINRFCKKNVKISTESNLMKQKDERTAL